MAWLRRPRNGGRRSGQARPVLDPVAERVLIAPSRRAGRLLDGRLDPDGTSARARAGHPAAARRHSCHRADAPARAQPDRRLSCRRPDHRAACVGLVRQRDDAPAGRTRRRLSPVRHRAAFLAAEHLGRAPRHPRPGAAQILLCGLAFGAIAAALGYGTHYAIILGGMLALSSTAVVVQTLAERGQQNCPVGLTGTAILIFQDICAIFILILATSIEDAGSSSERALAVAVSSAALKAAIAFMAAVLIGRYAIKPLFRLLSQSRNEEIFTAIALLIILATAAATGGAGLSHARRVPGRHDHLRDPVPPRDPDRGETISRSAARLLLHHGRDVARLARPPG